ncbi:MAG: histidinol dehydrogenase [Armatimonadetes bacterium]|nr:histidinol dehydrogenase [Armatimonadota bacterium]
MFARILHSEGVAAELGRWKHRIHADHESVERTVAQIIEDVRRRGDQALIESAQKFDSPSVSQIHVQPDEFAQALVDDSLLESIRFAAEQIRTFHDEQMRRMTSGWEVGSVAGGGVPSEARNEGAASGPATVPTWSWRMPLGKSGHRGQLVRPVRRAGIYVPGGNASYPSSVLMNAIPARCAGVGDIVIASPVQRSGSYHNAVLVAASEVGVRQILKVGGAAAIAAMVFGTESISRCDVVVGPGNKYVNEAKRQLWGHAGYDGYAGSSEVCVVADSSSNPAFVASDLLTQIEHAEDNQAWLVCIGQSTFDAVSNEIQNQVATAPRRETLFAALRNHAVAFIVDDVEQAAEIVNVVAPEHLSLSIENPEAYLPQIENAGCIMLGEWTPESGGDYVFGPSHTLPTAGAARFGSPVNVAMFLKFQSVLCATQSDLVQYAPHIERLAEAEGFPTHGRGSSIRFGR